MALAAFLASHARGADRRDLPVPGVAWSRGRLDEVAARARAVLDEETGQGLARMTPR